LHSATARSDALSKDLSIVIQLRKYFKE